MKDEYIIINKTECLKIIENNRKPAPHWDGIYVSDVQNARAELIEELLSKSVPLISEIDKAYEAGKLDRELSLSFDNPKGRYFSSLKLNI